MGGRGEDSVGEGCLESSGVEKGRGPTTREMASPPQGVSTQEDKGRDYGMRSLSKVQGALVL